MEAQKQLGEQGVKEREREGRAKGGGAKQKKKVNKTKPPGYHGGNVAIPGHHGTLKKALFSWMTRNGVEGKGNISTVIAKLSW